MKHTIEIEPELFNNDAVLRVGGCRIWREVGEDLPPYYCRAGETDPTVARDLLRADSIVWIVDRGGARCTWHDNLRDALRFADDNQPEGNVREDWLTSEILDAWLREWEIKTEIQPEYGEAPYQCIATRGADEVAAQHTYPLGAVKAACTLCITRRLWSIPSTS